MMKKIIMSLCVLFISFAIHSEQERKFVISADPVKAIHGSLAALAQYKINDFMALTVPFSFGTNWIAGQNIKTLAAISDEKYTSSQLFGSLGLGARFLLSHKGLMDGFFAEPRLTLEMRKYTLKNGDVDLVNSNRATASLNLLAGYSWFWDNGLFLSGSLMIGEGFHMKNDITVDKKLAHRIKDKSYVRNSLSADTSRWRFEYGYDLSIGYSW